MKWTKDTMSSPPPDATLNSLIAIAKSAGATHCELAQPLGLTNTASEMLRWATKIHASGMNITFRPADVDMEGLYGHPKAVGTLRKPQQYYIDECVNFIKANLGLFKDGDEWCPFPERTEGIFQDATSWISPNDPTTYANFFINLANACQTTFGTIKVQTGLSTNNGSELLSGWMPQSLINRAGYICVDHYVDNNATQLDSDLRAMFARYNKPIYLQETAPDRFNTPTAAELTAYFNVLTKLVSDGVLQRMGYWGFWSGTPEGAINADFTLNTTGQALKTFYNPVPTPPDLTTRVTTLEAQVAVLQNQVNTINSKLAAIKVIL